MIRLHFIISSLDCGGAQRQLALLTKGMNPTRFAITVVTIYDGGALRDEIEHLEGVRLVSLHKKGQWDFLRPTWKLSRILSSEQSDIVHGYMDVANLLALLSGKAVGARVVWGLRASDVDFALYGRRSAWIHRLASWLSAAPDLIVANSHAGMRHHVSEGYCDKRMVVIPNGFETRAFYPDVAAGQRMRHAWGVKKHEALIGLVARLDPMKDHRTFLRAAALLLRERRDVRFACVGGGPSGFHQELLALAEELGLADRLVWTGEVSDMRAVQNALDIATSSSSSGEGFSNAIGEAMACGVPCVVTDVGDSAILVGSTGLVVPAAEPVAMATAWKRLLDLPTRERTALGSAARQRIIEEYSIEQLVSRTESVLAKLMGHAPETRTSFAD